MVILRNQRLLLVCWAAVVVSIVVFVVVVIDGPGPDPAPADYLAIATICLASALGFHRATRMRLEMTDGGLTVYKLFTTERVAWHDISEVSVDYFGLHITQTDGRVVTAGSMGKANWASWFGQESDADRWVRQVGARVAAERREA